MLSGRSIVIGVAALVLGIVPRARAADGVVEAPYVWRNVKVGGGGFIPGIVFSRAEKGLAYLRSDMGGCYRWDAGEKRWVPLQDAMAESSYHGIESVAPDPVDPNVVYVAAGMYRSDPAAILRSADRGATWRVTPVPWKMGGNEDGRGLGERLAVDPRDTNVLYFGSRHDGLQRSTDAGRTWAKVDTFPVKGRGTPTWQQPTHGGLSFVVFAPDPAEKSGPTRTIFVGSSDDGDRHLYRSDDGGATWAVVPGEPGGGLFPAQAQYDDHGALYLAYANGIGPNGVTDGAVMKLDVKTNRWTAITPDRRKDRPSGGYMGISLDRQRKGTLAVATMNRWGPVDTVWRTTDDGRTWHDIVGRSERDVSATPFLLWGQREAKLGWWMAALAIDPFDSDHVAYATGATIYASHDFSTLSTGGVTHWRPWVEGIEQTAIITLASPAEGVHLLSGFGDIGGFAHDDLSKSPAGMYANPQFGNTNTIQWAGARPAVVVRTGRPNERQADVGYSEDGGRTWRPMVYPADPARQQQGNRRERGNPAAVVSADGGTVIVMTPQPVATRDAGKTWEKCSGLPEGARPVADRVNGAAFYALDFATARLHTSADNAHTFTDTVPTGLPADLNADRPASHEAAWPLHATPGKTADLWLVSKTGLYHSPDAGKSWSRVDGGVKVEMLAFGKPPAAKDYPALFAIGTRGTLRAVWRSDDAGRSWVRVNDDRHQWGTRFRCIAADPRVFGRVYVGTDGRGILYGEPSPAANRAGGD